MPSALNDALEWFDRAEQARETAEQLTDPAAREAVLHLAEHFEELARAASGQTRPGKGSWRSIARKGTRYLSRQLLGLIGSAVANGPARGRQPGAQSEQ
jgi:hypothetical protein